MCHHRMWLNQVKTSWSAESEQCALPSLDVYQAMPSLALPSKMRGMWACRCKFTIAFSLVQKFSLYKRHWTKIAHTRTFWHLDPLPRPLPLSWNWKALGHKFQKILKTDWMPIAHTWTYLHLTDTLILKSELELELISLKNLELS